MTIEKEFQEVTEALASKFDEFKVKNDKSLDAIKAEKSKLESTVDGLNSKLTEFESFKSKLEAELISMKRPGGKKAVSPEKREYKQKFSQFLRKGVVDGLADLERKMLQTNVGQDGGIAVPEDLDRNLIELLRDASPMRQVCDSITVSTPDYKRIVNLGGSGSGWVGEHSPRPTTGTPNLKAIQASMGEIYANPQTTQTSLDDLFFNAEQWVTNEVSQEFAQQEGLAFLMGDGVDKPKGLLAHTLSTAGDKARAFGELQNVHSGVAGSFNADNLLDLIYALRAGYRGNANFMMNNLTVARIRKLKDADGNYLWAPGLQIGQPSSVLGYGIVENEDMPNVASGANAVLFGDFKRAFLIVDRIGVRMLRDNLTQKPYVSFYTTKRVGSMLTDSNAVKVLTLSV